MAQITLNSSGVASNGTLALQSNGTTTAVTIDTSQNVGIGTASPNEKLQVNGAVLSTGALSAVRTSAASVDFLTGNTRFISMGADASTKGGFIWYNSTNAAVTEAMRIDSSGNVGIGTSSPGARLTVRGVGTTSATASFEAATSGGATRFYVQDDGTTRFFGSANAETARIDSSGNLLVGATASPSIYSIATFRGSNKGIAIQDSGSGKYRAIYMETGGGLYFYNGTNEGYLSNAGAWTNASDARLKTNVRGIEYGLATVLATQPRHYERVDVEGTYIGFVAQELQEVIPEVVSGDPEKQLGVDYGSLVALAFKAIQEQQAIIQTLTDRITALEQA